jgi:hypothetical protein
LEFRDGSQAEMSMARTPKKRRAAGTEATRRWRERRAQGRRLVTIEVAETTLARLAGQGLLCITGLDDPVAVAAALSSLVSTKKLFAGPVSDHALAEVQQAQGIQASNGVAENAGASASTNGKPSGEVHLHLQGRDARGCWLRGVSGNPAGKKPGTRNAGSAADQLLRALLDAALRGV